MALKKQKIILIICLALVFSLPLLASAHGLVPCGGTNEKPCNVQDIFSLIARVTNWLIFVAGIFAVFQIVWNSFGLIYSMGNEEGITKHKDGATQAIIGFVLVMIAYLGLNTYFNVILLDGADCQYKVQIDHPWDYVTGGNSCPTK